MAEFLPTYQGDANLGLGSTPSITPVANENAFASTHEAFNTAVQSQLQLQNERAKTLGDTQKTIALLDNENNVKMFAQKVADRDAMYKDFKEGNAKVGAYLPKDKTALDKLRNDYDAAYKEWNDKGINDRDALAKFKKASDALNDGAAVIATRYVSSLKDQQSIADEKLPETKKAKQAAYDKWANTSMAMPEIYQQIQNFDPASHSEQLVVDTTIVPDGYMDVTTKIANYKKTLDKTSKSVLENGINAQVNNPMFKGYYDTLPTEQKIKSIGELNKQLEIHNNLAPNDKVPLIEPLGNGYIKESDAEFTAKYLVASTPISRTPVENEKRRAEIERERNDKDVNARNWYDAYTRRMKEGKEVEKLNLQIKKLEPTGVNSPFDKALKFEEKSTTGNGYVPSKQLTDLDLAAITGFNVDQVPVSGTTKTNSKIVSKGRLLKNSDGDYLTVGQDEKGNKYLSFAVDKLDNKGKVIGVDYKRVYKNDVSENIKLMQAKLGGTKAINVFEKEKGSKPSKEDYSNVTETTKGTIGVIDGKWYDINTGKPIE